MKRFFSSQTIRMGGLSVLIGLLSSAGVWVFKSLFETLWGYNLQLPMITGLPWLGALLPVAGGAVVGLVAQHWIGEEKLHGTAAIMQSVAITGGRLGYQKSPVKTLAAALSIGAGASVGPEDPSVQIGANIASMIGQKLRVSEERLRTLIAAGAASSIAAAFNAPIAGVFFALEIILGEIGGQSLGMILIASVSSSVLIQALSGSQPAFQIPAYSFHSIGELPLYLLLGLAAGPVSAVYVRLLYQMKDLFGKIGLPTWLKPVLAGTVVGAVGLALPQVLGVGYETIGEILNRADFSIVMLLVLMAVKLVLTPVSIGGGFFGGVFAPSLFIGAALGGAVGEIGKILLPNLGIESAAFALVGMAAVLAGAVHAPLTAAILLFEMTGDYRIILPLMLAVAVIMLVSQQMQRDSVYAMGLARHGIRLDRGRDIEVLSSLTVGEVMESNPHVLQEGISLEEAAGIFARTRRHGLPVVSASGELAGVLTLRDIDAANETGRENLTVGDICTRDVVFVTPDESLSLAMQKMSQRDLGRLPVVDSGNPRKLVGILRRVDVIHAYSVAMTQRTLQRHRKQAARLDSLTPPRMAVNEIIVEPLSCVVGKKLSEIAFPQGSIIASIQRGSEAFVPHGETCLQAGDVLVAVAEEAAADEIGRMCTYEPPDGLMD